jgi:hypothetical protein
MTPEQTQIARLETELETMRQRCEAFETALSAGGSWEARVHPLSLYQTRLMRLIARKDMTGAVAVRTLARIIPTRAATRWMPSLYLSAGFCRQRLPRALGSRNTITLPFQTGLR